MERLVFHAPGDLRWESVPDPVLGDQRAALVRPLAVAACDLDVALRQGRAPLPGPLPLGHEFVAEVVAVGDAVTWPEPGPRCSSRSSPPGSVHTCRTRSGTARRRAGPQTPSTKLVVTRER